MSTTIYLTGFMGVGKSAAGRALAAMLDYGFYDTDSMIEKIAGKSISEIFQSDSEERFRDLERSVILSFNNLSDAVVALGGGAVAYSDNLKIIRSAGTLVTLTAPPGEIYRRISASKTVRPILACADPLKKIEELMYSRAYYYILGDILVDTDKKTVHNVALEISRRIPINV